MGYFPFVLFLIKNPVDQKTPCLSKANASDKNQGI
jgi:hypothetical protein